MNPTTQQNRSGIPWWAPIPALFVGLLAGFGGVLFPPAVVSLQPGTVAAGPKTDNNSGRLLYLAHCARCHGPQGRGDGPESAELAATARPRDFTADDWKFNSSHEAIEQVLLKGIPGTPMAAFGSTLGDLDRRQLVDYVRSLAPPAARLSNDHHQRDLVKTLVAQAGWQWSSDTIQPDAKLGSSVSTASETELAKILGQSPASQTGLHFVQVWGVHCAVCIEKLPEIPKMQSAVESHGFGFQLVCADEPDGQAVRRFLDSRRVSAPSLTDRGNGFKLRTELSLLPVSLILDSNGQVLAKYVGLFDWQKHWGSTK